MDFEECRKRCIQLSRLRGREDEAQVLEGHAAPGDEEWAECVHEAIESGEDIANPFSYMARYELRLAKQGIPTALGLAAGRFREEIRAAALNAGVPRDRLDDAEQLYWLLNGADQTGPASSN